ncbi:alpha/beta hydrolase [bacterium]|nr:alpha/beta hydrolase [bacterium]
MPEVEANGTRLFYQQTGTGPDVVLLHAVTSNQAIWLFSGLTDALAADYRVTTFDLRGHGQSERPPTGYTSADMAADFAALHAALGLRPAALVGHSFGGVTAVHAAALFPDRVRGVILSDSFFPALRPVEPNFGKMALWAEVREKFALVGVTLGETVDFNGLFRECAALDAERMLALEGIYGTFGRGWVRHLPRLAETTCGTDVMEVAGLTADVIAGVKQPVAALYDEFSPFLATCRWLEANLPACTAEIIPGAKHLAMLENAPGFLAAARRHLARIHPPAA